MVYRRTKFGERSEAAPDRGGKLQFAGGGGHKETFCRAARLLSTFPSEATKPEVPRQETFRHCMYYLPSHELLSRNNVTQMAHFWWGS